MWSLYHVECRRVYLYFDKLSYLFHKYLYCIDIVLFKNIVSISYRIWQRDIDPSLINTFKSASTLSDVQGMTLNFIHIFIVNGSFLYWCVMRPASQRFFILSCIYLRILIISYLATFLGTNSHSVLISRKAVNQSINQSTFKTYPTPWLKSKNMWTNKVLLHINTTFNIPRLWIPDLIGLRASYNLSSIHASNPFGLELYNTTTTTTPPLPCDKCVWLSGANVQLNNIYTYKQSVAMA